MRFRNPTWVVAVMAVAAGLTGCAQGPASHAVVVRHGSHARDGVGTFEALDIVGPAALSRLESCFPGYRRSPGSGLYGSWMTGYDVYIEDDKGRIVHILLPPDAGSWTVGKGDLEAAGDFAAFVRELRAMKPPAGASDGRAF